MRKPKRTETIQAAPPTAELPLDRVHPMDCVQGLAQLSPAGVDLAFADPPFNIGYAYDVYDDRQDADRYLDWCRQWMGGTGTTLVVAKKLARRFVGFELSPEYTAKIESRLATAQPGDPLDGAADPIVSAPATPEKPRQKNRRAVLPGSMITLFPIKSVERQHR